MKKNTLSIALAVLVVGGLFYLLLSFGDKATLRYPGGELEVLVADNAIEHQKGLSGTRLETLDADGMLFVFGDQEERVFWMKGMNYDLDFLWIADNKIVKIDRFIEAPSPGEEPISVYSRPFEVDMVLELPAGRANELGLLEGHVIEVVE